MTGSWLTTADHKRIGQLYIVTALGFLVVGGVFGGLARVLDLDAGDYLRVVDLHSTATAVLVLAPLWLGLATYLVPLQIGAARLAFPRLQSFAFWTYAFGGVLHLLSYLGDGPRIGGIGFSQLTAVVGGSKEATDLWVASLAVVTIAGLLAAANLLATVLAMRTEGLTLARLPMFSWATLISSAGTLLAAPVFLAGLLLLYLDQHFGGAGFFSAGTVGTQVVWQHTLWLYGRPDLYLLLVPALGAASDIVASAAGRPLADTRVARVAIAATAAFGFGAWASGTKVADAIVLPTYSVLTGLVAVPIAVLILLWLDTLRRGGRPKLNPALLFVVGFILFEGAGLAAEAAARFNSVDGTAWSTGHTHLVDFGAGLLLALGAICHWAPKMWGRPFAAGEAGLQFLLVAGGSAIFAAGMYGAGWKGAMRGVKIEGSTTLLIAGVGGAILLLGALAAAGSVLSRVVKPGTYDADGLTLEWATSSPPPAYNFDTLPEVRSDTPHADLHAAEVASPAPIGAQA